MSRNEKLQKKKAVEGYVEFRLQGSGNAEENGNSHYWGLYGEYSKDPVLHSLHSLLAKGKIISCNPPYWFLIGVLQNLGWYIPSWVSRFRV